MTLDSGIRTDELDPATRPQDDLFRHVNGKWIDRTEIPADKARWGSFMILAEESEAAVREIVERAQHADEGTEERKFGDLFTSFLDEERVDALGVEPIRDELTSRRGVDSIPSLLETVGKLERRGLGGFYQLFVDNDPGDPERYLVFLEQAGISPARRVVLPRGAVRPGPRGVRRAHPADARARRPRRRGGARAARVRPGDRDRGAALGQRARPATREKTYNLYDWADAKAVFDGGAAAGHGADLDVWAQALGAPQGALAEVVLRQPTFIAGLAGLLTEDRLESWRDWLAWQVIHGAAPYLSGDFVDANFDFYGRTLTGTPQMRARWKRGVSLVEGAMGEAVGRIYVEQHFPPAAKAAMDVLVGNLIEAYRQSIRTLDWMGEETRERALDKLEKFTPKIGYPVKWRDYSALEIDPTDLVGNVRAAALFEFNRELGKIGKPLDRDEWFMTPQTINAYYNPGFNEIVFPAAILQFPFFDADAGRRGELRRDRRGHRPRDRARLRRPGLEVRRRRPPRGLVDRGRPRRVRGAHREPHRAVRRARAGAGAGPPRERRAHHRREHRRPGRSRHRVEGLPALAGRRRSRR